MNFEEQVFSKLMMPDYLEEHLTLNAKYKMLKLKCTPLLYNYSFSVICFSLLLNPLFSSVSLLEMYPVLHHREKPKLVYIRDFVFRWTVCLH